MLEQQLHSLLVGLKAGGRASSGHNRLAAGQGCSRFLGLHSQSTAAKYIAIIQGVLGFIDGTVLDKGEGVGPSCFLTSDRQRNMLKAGLPLAEDLL